MTDRVFPRPRRAELAGGRGDPALVAEAVDAALPPQGYRLTITPTGTTLEHRDGAGRRYGRDTLDQLEQTGTVPEGVVEDAPALPVRSYMLDISRDRVPTNETLDWLVTLLGRLRINELQLYTEHTFAWPEHEVVWRDASPLTDDDLRWLRDRCTAEGIELVPCLNGFGHMERFLRHDAYRHRAECPDGAPSPFGGGTVPPTTLAPTPENAAFALGLFRRYLQALPSTRVHIGGDEPFELGRCRSRERVEREGRATVYLEHLRRLLDPLVADGHEVLFWGDVLRTSAEHVAALPRDGVVPVVWHYEAPVDPAPPMSTVLGAELVEALGLPEDGLAGFFAHTRSFADHDVAFRVAPGTSTWNSLIGRWPNARENITDGVRTAVDHGAAGLQLADWGDNGHHHPLVVSLPPLVHAAAATWSGDGDGAAAVPETIDRLLGTEGLGERLVALGEVHDRLGVRSVNASPLCQAVLRPVEVDPAHLAEDAVVEDVLELLDDTSLRYRGLSGTGPELAAVCDLARVGVERLAAAAGRPTAPASDTDARLRDAVELQREAWLGSSRPGGLEDSLARITATLDPH